MRIPVIMAMLSILALAACSSMDQPNPGGQASFGARPTSFPPPLN